MAAALAAVALSIVGCTRVVTHEPGANQYHRYDAVQQQGQNSAGEPSSYTAVENPTTPSPADPPAYDGSWKARARLPANVGGDPFARGSMNVEAPMGSEGYYGAAFYFPPGTFTGSRPKQTGSLEIMGWSNDLGESGGIKIGPDHKARLFHDTAAVNNDIGPRFTLREGCWNWLVVHQRLGDGVTTAPINEVFLNGVRVVGRAPADYSEPNSAGGAEAVAWGAVSADAAAESSALEFYVDNAYVSDEKRLGTGGRAVCRPLPNVLMIVTDDQRADTASGTLGPLVMPKTRKWFRDGSASESIAGGTEFSKAYATTPLCCPSRASIFSGRYVHNHGVEAQATDLCDDQPHTMQAHLQRFGYHTAIFGKYLNGWGKDRLSCAGYPANHPPYFDEFAILDGGYASANPNADCSSSPTFTCVFEKQSNGATSYRELPEYATTFLRKKAEGFIERSEAEDANPWFLYLATTAPHGPPEGQGALGSMTRNSGYHRRAVPAFRAGPAHNEVDRSDKPSWVKGTAANPLGWSDKRQIFETSFGTTTYFGLREQQLRTLKAVDDVVDALFRKLGKAEADNTLAVFVSDNGHMWREHGPDTGECYTPRPGAPDAQRKACGLSSKGMPYLDAVHIPLFMRWPRDTRVATGVTNPKLVANIDLAPTVLDAIGIGQTDVPMDGRSLFGNQARSQLLLEKGLRINVSGNSVPRWASLLTPTYHYTRYEDSLGLPLFQEWYDISPSADPGEQVNRFGSNGRPDPGEPEPPDLTSIRNCAGPACP